MPEITESAVQETLKTVRYPGFSRDIVSFGLLKAIWIQGGEVRVQLALSTNDPRVPQQIKHDAEAALRDLPGVEHASVLIDITAAPQQPAAGQSMATSIEGVRHVVAVASGKGGVGKSTVAANLAVAFHGRGYQTGLCDCDMYGPSMALMFGTNERPSADEETQRIRPIVRHGVKLMSMGFLLDDAAPAILRGPMVTKYTQQFLRQVDWGNLDVLVLDLPPGTGDIQLTIVQTVALAGAVIVTTPQEVALIDARKAGTMFQKVNVPVLGIVENMSYFLCPGDGVRYDIFGSGGGAREAKRLGVPLLGQVPIEIPVREWGDRGTPVVAGDLTSSASVEFAKIATTLAEQLKF